jgi:DNA repair and recombination protein RAD54B
MPNDISGGSRIIWLTAYSRRKFTNKKHKTWDGDGVLSIRGGYANLQDISGREMGKCMFKEPLLPGSSLSVGGKDVEVDAVITREDYLAGRPFLKSAAKRTPSLEEGMTKPIPKPNLVKKERVHIIDGEDEDKPKTVAAKNFYAGAAKSTTATNGQFKTPLLSTTVMPQDKGGVPTPRHNPNAPGAVVMRRPKDCPKGKQIVDVVLDPFLGQWIREHQREGVKFLYECVMGMRPFDGNGALLADDMGLGKTFTTIALLWTLLKQNPIHGSESLIKKALVVCPVTLIKNWKKEFKRWLGNERCGVFVADGNNIRITDFTHGRSYSVMIIGYEKLRSVQAELKKGGGIDIIICDEGHRLKTDGNKAAQAIKTLNTPRRVILSGTPVQNDLSELFVMVDFVNPGILGTYKTFKKEFETPILASRNPDATEKVREKGDARQEELSNLTKQFILRREASLLAKYLLPKTEYVVFCKPTQAQAEVYQNVLNSPVFNKLLGSSEASLQLITILKKVCNSPTLLLKTSKTAPPSNDNVATLLESIPPHLLRASNATVSSKVRVLDRMLRSLSETTKEKIVLVSNYTSTLDMLGHHLSSLSLPYLRLDGSTQTGKRQDLVDQFNREPASKSFAFLLSAKSGGAGINLIGASRLVLFDVDWNPATDLQAMARIHRDGQKREVKIYRFLMAGGMDEKIYQRQVTKMGLADSVMDGKRTEASFSAAELRDLFTLHLQVTCQTHDLLGCGCNGRAVEHPPPSSLPEPVEDAETGNDEDSDDDEYLLPANPALMCASKVNMEAQEKKILEDAKEKLRQKAKGKMQSLMQYTHVDASIFAGETKDVFNFDLEEVTDAKKALADEVLVSVLREKNCKVSFVFVKKG